MLLAIVHFINLVRHKRHHLDNFEEALYVMTIALFAALFIRVLVALYMGRWEL